MTICHPGYCKVCHDPTHKIEKQFPIGHPLAGRPMQLGQTIPGTVKAYMILTDGRWSPIVLHSECADALHDDPTKFPQLWRDVMETFMFEEKNRKALGAEELSADQGATMMKSLARMVHYVPLAVVCLGED